MKTEAGGLETAKSESSLLYSGSKIALTRFVQIVQDQEELEPGRIR